MKSPHILLILAALMLPISAQQKVSERTSLSAAALAPASDVLPIVDISAGLSGSKKITIDDLFLGWGMTTSGAALAKAANATAQRTALGLGTAATSASTAFEPALGNPSTNGYVLSSTAAGVRSWIEPASGGGSVVVADETDIEVGTDNTKVMTPLRTHQTLAYFGMSTDGFSVAQFNNGMTAAVAEIGSLSVFDDFDLASGGQATISGNLSLALAGSANGDLYYRNSSGNFARLPIGTSGQVLKVASGLPSWGAAAGGGGDLLAANNLSDLANVATARTNLGLGSAATAAAGDFQPSDADLSSWAGVARASGFDTLAATPTSENLASLLTDEIGGGFVLFGDQPVYSSSSVQFEGMDINGILYARNDLQVSGVSYSSGGFNGSGLNLTDVSPANFTAGLGVSAPNTTVPAARLIAKNAATNVDAVFSSKGTGAILAQLPNNATTGGDKRGTNAVDWQQVRSTNTMVASGTRATISGGQNNSATQDYCSVGGGSSNNCRGNNSVIAGGSGNTTAASTITQTIAGGSNNETTQPYATVGGGRANIASGQDATVVGGAVNEATGAASVAGGWDNTASGTSATSFGWGNVASGNYTTALGFNSTTRSTNGAISQSGGMFAAVGDAQAGKYSLRKSTTNATPTPLNTDGANGRIVLPNNSTYSFSGQLTARSSGGDSATWRFTGTIERGASAATTALVGTPTITDTNAEAGASTWAIAISVDTTNGALVITATGAASTNIRWVAQVETAEVVY